MAAAKALPDSGSDYYVYVHRKKTDGSVFYVGKGHRRRWKSRANRNDRWHKTVNKHGFTAEKVLTDLTEAEAFEHEKRLIAEYGRENLCNMTDGGDGPSGYVMSEEHRRAFLAAARRFHTGHKRPPEWAAAISAANKGQIVTREHREAIRAKLKGQVLSAETRAKMSASQTGRKRTPEEIESCRRSWTPERRAKQRIGFAEKWFHAVVCVETGQRFESLKAAGEWLATFTSYKSHLKISSVCRGERKTAYGYHWRYAD